MRRQCRKREKKWYLIVDLPRGLDGKRYQKWIPLGRDRGESERAASMIGYEVYQLKTKEEHGEEE